MSYPDKKSDNVIEGVHENGEEVGWLLVHLYEVSS